MTDCKNCPYTDEYCASGECTSQSPRNGSQNGDLTSQWKKGELPECEYYIRDKEGNTSTMSLWNDERCKLSVRCKRLSILAPVPSYEEWKASEKYNKHLEEVIKIYERKDKQATETSVAYNKLLNENAQLKELLKRVVKSV